MNEYGSGCDDAEVWSLYMIEMSWFIVLFFEGASMGVLMIFHCMNFKLFSSQDKEDLYASIMPGEYILFTSEDLDTSKLRDESSYLL